MERHFKPAAIKAGLCVRTVRRGNREALVTDLRMHDLRHTTASLAERLQAVHDRARSEAAATPARPSSAPAVVQIGKAAGQ
jgi:hypothetical protein